MFEDIPHRGRRDVGELLRGRYDDGLYFRGKPSVGVGYGTLILEVEHVPDSSHDVTYSELPAYIHGESVILDDADSFHVLHGLPDDVQSLFVGEEAPLVLVDAYRDYNSVKHGEGTPEDVQVPCCKWVERPGKQCRFVHDGPNIAFFAMNC